LFLADDGCDIFQCDLSGADGWTVAAHCARLGDPTMLDDLQAGVKIAKVVALMFTDGPEVSYLQRPELKQLTDKVRKDDPIYFGSKCCQHGTNYGMGKVLLSATIFVQSEGRVVIPAKDAERLQNLYHRRYPGIRLWHEWVDREVKTKGYLTSASGHRRLFFGRRNDHTTLKSAYANEAQENTTYVTNRAALNMWHDKENKRSDGSLRSEPLHQVHDALLGQWRKLDTGWAKERVKYWFDFTIEIAGIPIRIPFEGRYGDSWGNLAQPL